MGAARGVGPLPVLTGPLVAPAHGRRVWGMGEVAWGEDLGEVWWRGVRVGSSFRVVLTPFECAMLILIQL
jgi:hypothetical protein